MPRQFKAEAGRYIGKAAQYWSKLGQYASQPVNKDEERQFGQLRLFLDVSMWTVKDSNVWIGGEFRRI